MKILETLIFGAALFGTIYFTCRFFIWLAFKVHPEHFKHGVEKKDIRKYNIVGFVSLFLWMVLFYLNI